LCANALLANRKLAMSTAAAKKLCAERMSSLLITIVPFFGDRVKIAVAVGRLAIGR
jgi:hypothetical protein